MNTNEFRILVLTIIIITIIFIVIWLTQAGLLVTHHHCLFPAN